MLAGALTLPGVVECGGGAAAAQTKVGVPSAATAPRNSALPQPGSSGQDAQTTPQNPPLPESNPAQQGQKPPPSSQNPPPSAQLPEPAIRNPEVEPAPKPAIAPPALTIPRLSRAPALEDFLDMKPEGEIAQQMAKVTGFVQRNPHDGEKVSEETAAYLGYDQKNVYVVFVCFDDPTKVRARMSAREDIHDDDQVDVMLDTFHDRRRAYEFQTTAARRAVGCHLYRGLTPGDGRQLGYLVGCGLGFAGQSDQRRFRGVDGHSFQELAVSGDETAGVGTHSVSRNCS